MHLVLTFLFGFEKHILEDFT